MPYEVSIVTDTSTDGLETRVRQKQVDGWSPTGGLLWLNARYHQLMVNVPMAPLVQYCVVSATSAEDFRQKANSCLNHSPGSHVLNDVLQIQGVYIQAIGDTWELQQRGNSGSDISPPFDVTVAGDGRILYGNGNEAALFESNYTMIQAENVGVKLILDGFGARFDTAAMSMLLSNTGELSVDGQTYNLTLNNDQIYIGTENNVFQGGATETRMDYASGDNDSHLSLTGEDVKITVNDSGVTLNSASLLPNTQRPATPESLGNIVHPWETLTVTRSPWVADALSYTSPDISPIDLQLWSTVTPKVVTYNGTTETRYTSGSLIGSLGALKAKSYGLLLEDDGTPGSYAVNQTACLAFEAAYIRSKLTPINEVLRVSFTTAAAEATQYVTADNTPQVVTYNAQQIPNAALGTVTNATGVFLASTDIQGMLAISCQVRRTTGGAAAVTWGIHLETSPDGTTWTPVAGSSRRVNLRGGGDNNIMQMLGLTTSVNLPSGTRLRVMQSCDLASSNTGLVAAPSALGTTTSAGIIMSLYTVKN